MFALIVMVVAACEVVVGLGLIVAMFRRRLPLNVDDMREPARDERHHLRAGSSSRSRWPGSSSTPSAGACCAAARPGGSRPPRSGSRSSARSGPLVSLLGHGRRATASSPRSLWTYASAGGLDIKLGILVDPLSVFMILVVSGVSTLIHLYSVAYLDSDRGYSRYFAYLNFFVFSMLLLVLAGNFVLLIVGWAFVGFASYALISFWYRRNTATKAGMKAFVINVIGDVGLVFAAFFIFRELGSLRLPRPSSDAAPQHFATNQGVLIAICLLLLVGRVREVGAAPAPHLAPGRDGGPDAGLGADPRRDDGDRRRLPDRAHVRRSSSWRRPRPTSRRSSGSRRCSSRRPARSRSPTSSGSSPTRRSARSATWSSGSRSAPTRPASST